MRVELSNEQVQYIQEELTKEEIHVGSLKEELLDHICCEIENKIATGTTFHHACEQAFASFGENGIQELQSQTIHLLNQKSQRMKNVLIAATALVLPFLFFSVDRLSSNLLPTKTEITEKNTSCKHIVKDYEVVDKRIDVNHEVFDPMTLNVPPLSFVEEPPSLHPLMEETKMTSGFGMRFHPVFKKRKMHTGVDFKAPLGTPVYATSDGVIQTAKSDKENRKGKHITIQHDETYATSYFHLNEIKVEKGQQVKKGDIIGTVGSTGMSMAPHLHYEVRVKGKAVDPIAYLKP